jgi:hypothetical protein
VEDFGERLEDDSFVGILERELLACKVLVLAIHNLNLDIILEALLEILVAADVQLDIPEIFNPPRFIFDVDARNVSPDLAAEELGQNILGLSSLHLLLHALHKLARKLLYILLLENVSRFPAEGFGKLIRAYGSVRCLELIKESLEGVCAILEGLFILCRNLIDSLTG